MTHPIHPMLVHFPIALLFASVLFDLLSFYTGREDFKKGGFWLLIFGWTAALTAVATGLLSEEIVEKAGVPKEAIERHEFFAMTTLALFAGLMGVRFWIRQRWSSRDRLVYTAVALVGLSLLATTGFWGGDLVYRYGAGVQSKVANPANPPDVISTVPTLQKEGAGG